MLHHVRYHKEIDEATIHLRGTSIVLTNSEIIKLTKAMFNNVDERFIQGTDHCKNHQNKGHCECQGTDKSLFNYNGRNNYIRI